MALFKNWRRGRDSNPGSGGYPRQRFSKPLTPGHNSSPVKGLGQASSERAAPGAARPQEAQTPPDLERVMAAWPGLPQHIKAAVLALVNTAEV